MLSGLKTIFYLVYIPISYLSYYFHYFFYIKFRYSHLYTFVIINDFADLCAAQRAQL